MALFFVAYAQETAAAATAAAQRKINTTFSYTTAAISIHPSCAVPISAASERFIRLLFIPRRFI